MTDDLLIRRDLVGTWLLSRYELRALVGRGGMGEVYEAVDHQLGRTVAIKVLRQDLATDRRLLARFRREARMSARLSHPGVVAVHDIGERDGQAFIVMEFVAGRTLESILATDGPLPPARAAWIAEEVAEALAHAHDRGVVHRDIAPSNVMVTPAGEIKVLDFGIARASRSSSSSEASSSVHGTMPYVAPERVRGEQGDGRVDIYALGAVLQELLTGRPPAGDARTPSGGTRAPRSLAAIVGRCLEPDPASRFGSAHELAAALRDARATGDVVAPIRHVARSSTAPVPRLNRTAILPAVPVVETKRRRRVRPAKVASVSIVTLALLGASWVVGAGLMRTGVVEPTVRHAPPVPAPTGLTVSTACGGWFSTRADLSWTPGGPSGGYEVWRRQFGEDFVLVAHIADWHTTSFSDHHLGLDVTYDYLVRAVRGKRTSPPTSEVPAPTPLFCLT
jgi:tRNA A-37 threonylcarbamoyl transferase component Bud32